MKTIAGIHYEVIRKNTMRYWEEPMYAGDIVKIDCSFCDFEIRKNHVRKPRTSRSGLGRYNRMRGIIVKHLHEKHRELLSEATEDHNKFWDNLINGEDHNENADES